MGWQRQAHGPSVQQAIEEAAAEIVGTEPLVYGCGRTDSGVHAVGQVAHVDIDRDIAPFRLMEALNARLRPAPVAILACEEVADDFHARFSCTGRAYRYRIRNRRAPLTLTAGREWQVAKPLDEAAMQAAADHLVGKHDFTTFRSAHCQSASSVKSIDRLSVDREGDLVIITAEAPSFLHHQIRSITGCLVMVGDGRWTPADMKAALDARDRAALGFNAPPDGLYFWSAAYPS
jgi:tRNA pseudouridine38-40 synthase